jgi:hypothetical protein
MFCFKYDTNSFQNTPAIASQVNITLVALLINECNTRSLAMLVKQSQMSELFTENQPYPDKF